MFKLCSENMVWKIDNLNIAILSEKINFEISFYVLKSVVFKF